MASKIFDTVIIGAGVSGLACAKQLQEHHEDFVMVSKDIGGRILTSEKGNSNYGAFFVCSDYHNFLPFVTIGDRIRLRDFCFHDKDERYVLFEPKLLPYSLQFMKILHLLYKFRKAFRKFRKASEIMSQKEAIERDSFLNELYMKNAADFVKEHKLQAGTETYLSKSLYSTTFSTIHEMNALSYLQFLLPLITPIYTFTFEKERMISSFRDKIVLDCVTDVQYTNDQYTIKSNKHIFSATSIVFATEITWSKHFASVHEANRPVSTHMLHVQGRPKTIIAQKRYQLFSPLSSVQAIADLKDGTYLFYFKDECPPLKKYFIEPRIIAHHFWNPAGTINGQNLIESKRGNNMYLIGDYNVAGLEESYITGLFAANQIIRSH